MLEHKTTLPASDRNGSGEILASICTTPGSLIANVDLVSDLNRLTEGNPILVQLYVDALQAEKQQVFTLRPEDLHDIQPGLTGYFEYWWQAKREQWDIQKRNPFVEQTRLKFLLSAVAASFGPLTKDDLVAIHPDLADCSLLQELQETGIRWLIGDGKTQGYRFSNPQLGSYFWGELDKHEQQSWDECFCNWGTRILYALNDGTLAQQLTPPYLVQYYALHLNRSDAPNNEFYALISDGWRRASEVVDISLGSFLNDIEIANQRAIQAYRTCPSHRAEALLQQVRVALYRASIVVKRSNMQPTLFTQLVDNMTCSSLVDALRSSWSTNDGYSLVNALTTLAPFIPKNQRSSILREALRAVQSINDPYSRVKALTVLAPLMSKVQRRKNLRDALRITQAIRTAFICAEIIVMMAPLLPVELLDEALLTARSINSTFFRTKALVALYSLIPQNKRGNILKNALGDARTIVGTDYHAETLIALIPLLPRRRREQALWETVHTAMSTNYKSSRVKILTALAPLLTRELLAKVLDNIQLTNDADALIALISNLPFELVGETLPTARSIKDASMRARALTLLFPRMPQSQKSSVIEDVLLTAQSINDPYSLISELTMLAFLIPQNHRSNVIGVVLQAIQSIKDASSQVDEPSVLTPQLPDKLIDEAIRAARSIELIGYHVDRVAFLVSYLPIELTSEILRDIQSMGSTFFRVKSLTKAAPLLPTELLGEALRTIQLIDDISSRTAVLTALIPKLVEWATSEPPTANLAFVDTISLLAARNRLDFLADLSALMPFIVALAGDEATTLVDGTIQAIQETCLWWS